MADEFEDVFILASDVVNFTKMSAASQPKDVVRVLSQASSQSRRSPRDLAPNPTRVTLPLISA